MGEYYGLVCTILGFVLVILALVIVSFQRKLYYMVEEADARCIQIRNMLERLSGEEATRHAAQEGKKQ
jgi:uncharacterized membrane protein